MPAEDQACEGSRTGPAPGATNTYRLLTEHLVLQPLQSGDGRALFPLVHGEAGRAVTDHLCWDGPDCEAAMDEWARRNGGCPFDEGGFHWVLRDSASGAAVGSIGLAPEGCPGRAELGYYLAPALWGRGLMREALEAVLRLGFGPLRLAKMEARVFTTNHRGLALAKAMGFHREGTLRRGVRKRGVWKDLALYGMLPKEGPTPRESPGGAE